MNTFIMETEMSLARVLKELKTLGERISKKRQGIDPIAVKDSGKIDRNFSEEEFVAKAKSDFDSLQALIERRHTLKVALMRANATHEVTIGKKKMTIQEAIDYKTVIIYKKEVLTRLKMMLSNAKTEYEQHTQHHEDVLNSQIQNMLGKDNTGSKGDAAAVSEYTRVYNENHKVEMVDPLNLKRVVEDLETEIEDFDTDVDVALSEANAVIKVTV